MCLSAGPPRFPLATYLTILFLIVGLALTARPAGAVPTRVEAENISHSTSCWAVGSDSGASNGQFRNCGTAAQALTSSFTIGAGGDGRLRFFGFRAGTIAAHQVVVRWRLNGGSWTTCNTTGSGSLGTWGQWCTATTGLAPGSYTLDLEWVSGNDDAFFDYFDHETLGTATTTTTAAPTTTTTTEAPATTTTTGDPDATTTSTLCGTAEAPCYVRVEGIDWQGWVAMFSVGGLAAGAVVGAQLMGGLRR